MYCEKNMTQLATGPRKIKKQMEQIWSNLKPRAKLSEAIAYQKTCEQEKKHLLL